MTVAFSRRLERAAEWRGLPQLGQDAADVRGGPELAQGDFPGLDVQAGDGPSHCGSWKRSASHDRVADPGLGSLTQYFIPLRFSQPSWMGHDVRHTSTWELRCVIGGGDSGAS